MRTLHQADTLVMQCLGEEVPTIDAARLWTLMNRPRPIHSSLITTGCAFLALYYVGMAILRHDPAHPDFLVSRGGIAIYGVIGVVLGRRGMSFAAVRWYTLGLALVVTTGGAWVGARLGQPPTQLPLTGLSTFVGMAFLQTAADVALVAPVVLVTQLLLLYAMPPPDVSTAAVLVMVLSALIVGALTSVLRIGLSAQLTESMDWWRAACERERAALHVKSEFLSTMSHELRSPLHVIIGYADLLREEVPTGLQAPLERMRSSAMDLLQLVENTMNASRLEAGKLSVHLETFDPAAMLHEMTARICVLPEARGPVALVWDVPPTLPAVDLDRLKLQEIVQNLASNALKFTLVGSVTVAARVEAGGLRITVRDTGPGIPAAAQERMFEMFERGTGTNDPARPGVGLGLYIVRNLVALMGGTIGLESAAGHGSCFTVEFPACVATAQAA